MEDRFILRDRFETELESFETFEEAKRVFDRYILQNRTKSIEVANYYEIYDSVQERIILVS